MSEPGSPDHVTEKAIKKKRASGEVVDEDGDSEMGNAAEEEVASKPVGRQSKKAKKSDRDTTVDLPLVKYRMLVTGDERWKDNPKKEDKDAVSTALPFRVLQTTMLTRLPLKEKTTCSGRRARPGTFGVQSSMCAQHEAHQEIRLRSGHGPRSRQQ